MKKYFAEIKFRLWRSKIPLNNQEVFMAGENFDINESGKSEKDKFNKDQNLNKDQKSFQKDNQESLQNKGSEEGSSISDAGRKREGEDQKYQ
jgi:hypothetical protein